MIKKVYEELVIHVDNEELARLLSLEPGFTLQHIEEVGVTTLPDKSGSFSGQQT